MLKLSTFITMFQTIKAFFIAIRLDYYQNQEQFHSIGAVMMNLLKFSVIIYNVKIKHISFIIMFATIKPFVIVIRLDYYQHQEQFLSIGAVMMILLKLLILKALIMLKCFRQSKHLSLQHVQTIIKIKNNFTTQER